MIKPVVEIMASVPSVVIGFLIALWLAPIIERWVLAFFLSLVTVPADVRAFMVLWQVPRRCELAKRVENGYEFLVLLPVLLAGVAAAVCLAGPLEAAALRRQLPPAGFSRGRWACSYDQRNYIIIAFGLGFTVIPIIFSIAEDSLSNVPYSMTAASMAAGRQPLADALARGAALGQPGHLRGHDDRLRPGGGRDDDRADGHRQHADPGLESLQRHADALGQHRRRDSRGAGGRNALSGPVSMRGPAVPIDVHGEHGGRTGPPAAAKTFRPVLTRPPPAQTVLAARRAAGLGHRRSAGRDALVGLHLLAVVLMNGLGVFWPAGRGRSHAGRRQQPPRRAIRSQSNPDTGQRAPSSRPATANKTRAAGLPLGQPTDPGDHVSARGLRVGTDRERRLLRLSSSASRGPT